MVCPATRSHELVEGSRSSHVWIRASKEKVVSSPQARHYPAEDLISQHLKDGSRTNGQPDDSSPKPETVDSINSTITIKAETTEENKTIPDQPRLCGHPAQPENAPKTLLFVVF